MSDQQTERAGKPEDGDIESKELLDIVMIVKAIEDTMEHFVALENVENNMTGAERRRLIGAGVRNWGFIDKAHDIARDNPSFLPPNFSAYDMAVAVREFEEIRQLVFTLNQFQQVSLNRRNFSNLSIFSLCQLPGDRSVLITTLFPLPPGKTPSQAFSYSKSRSVL